MQLSEAGMREVFAKLRPLLDERQRRVLAGLTARALGRGGVAQVSSVFGLSRKTVTAAVAEVDAGLELSGRVRRRGAGRKKLIDHDPDLLVALDSLVEPESRGDPMCRLRWTVKSTRTLAEELAAQGHPVSSWTVAQLLHYMDYSLQANSKTLEQRFPGPSRHGPGARAAESGAGERADITLDDRDVATRKANGLSNVHDISAELRRKAGLAFMSARS